MHLIPYLCNHFLSIQQFQIIMDFTLTEEHMMIRDAARDFAQTELLPGVIERDNKQEFPQDLVKKMGDLGFMGIMVDPKYGGSGSSGNKSSKLKYSR